MKNIAVTRILGNSRRMVVITTVLESVLVSALSFIVALFIASAINNQFGIKLFEYLLDFEAAIPVLFILLAFNGRRYYRSIIPRFQQH